MKKSKLKFDEITLVLLVTLIALVVSVYEKANKPKEMEAEKITVMIMDDHDISFASNGVIDESKLNQIKNIDYDDFKKYLKAKNDFCIYVEDGNGNIIIAKGSDKLNRDGLYCSD